MIPKYVSHFTPSQKLSDTSTRMATVEVVRINGHKVIGSYSWNRQPSEKQISEMVGEIIRDYELHKVWSRT